MKHGKYAGLVNGTPEFRAANAAAKREARAAKRKAAAKIDFWSWSDEFYASPDCALVRQEQELFKKQVEQELGAL